MTWPIPTTISPQARQALEATVAAAVPPAPHNGDIGGWRHLVETMRLGVEDAVHATAPNLDAETVTNTHHTADVPVHIASPGGDPKGLDDPTATPPVVVLNLHGGAFALGGGEACRAMGVQLAHGTGMPTYSVDYRLVPEHAYPAALDDCLAAYRWLLESFAPEQIVVLGQSAGGCLAAALLLRARDEGLPRPRAAILLTPEADLSEQGDSFELLGRVEFLTGLIQLYAERADIRSPYLSPINGDLSDFPPTMLQTGTRDLFLSNTVRMHRALRRAGVDARLHVWEAMPHGGFGGGVPEDFEIYVEIRQFLQEVTAGDLAARPIRGQVDPDPTP